MSPEKEMFTVLLCSYRYDLNASIRIDNSLFLFSGAQSFIIGNGHHSIKLFLHRATTINEVLKCVGNFFE